MYKFVSASAAAAGAEDAGMAKLAGQTIQAINNLGSVVNTIAGLANDLRNIQLANLDELKRKKIFEAKFDKPEKAKFTGFVNDFIGRGAPKFWEALLNMFSGLLKLMIIRPILKWLADPANKEKIEKTLETLDRVFRFLKAFVGTNVTRILDGLYDLLRDDATLWQRIGGFVKAMVAMGALLAPLMILRNPRGTIMLLRNSLKLFHTGLLKFHKGLRLRKLGRIGKLATVATAIGGTAYVAKKGFDYGQDIADRMEPSAFGGGSGDKTLMEFSGSFSMDDIKGGGQTVIGEMVNRIGNLERAYGGLIPREEYYKHLPQRATGGWINGPDSGYPVSLGRKGGQADFIGHGLEYVAKNNKGEDFVIPVNNFATRSMPGLTSANMKMAHAQGFDIPGELPRGKDNFFAGELPRGKDQFFWGSIKKWASNKFTDNHGISSLWSNKPKNQGAPEGSGWFGKAMNWGKNLLGFGKPEEKKPSIWQNLLGNAGQIGQSIFGNRGGAIGGAIQTIFGGGGSGEDGKATGWDIAKSVMGVAGSFMDPGSKAANWLGKIGGIGNAFFGPGSEGMTFGEKLGSALGVISGGDGMLGQVGNALSGGQIGEPTGWADQGSMRVGEGGAASGGGPIVGRDGVARSPNGGIQAAIRSGRTALQKGFTVSNHPNFRNNKWKGKGANRRGEDTSGRQPVRGGKLHQRGLAIDITDHRKGQNAEANLRAYADELFGNRKGQGIAVIANNKWGTWTTGGNKKGPGSHTKPNTTTVGFADRQVAGQGGVGLGESDLRMMKKAIVSEAGSTDTTQGALFARSIFNQAQQIDSGASSSMFGGAKTPTEIIENLFPKTSIWDKQLSAGENKAGENMISLGMDTKTLFKKLKSTGLGDDYASALMGASSFGKGDIFGASNKDTTISWGDMNFALKDGKTEMGEAHQVYGDKKKGGKWFPGGLGGSTLFPSQMNTAKEDKQTNTNYGGGTAQQTSGSGSSGSILGGPQQRNKAGGDGQGSEDGRNQSMMKKVTEQRTRAQAQMRQSQTAMVQSVIESVQANNQAVRSSVAAAQSAIANLLAKSRGGNPQSRINELRSTQASLNNSNFNALIQLRGV